jgi:uncharacterized phiE125 gp8 family phage protein
MILIELEKPAAEPVSVAQAKAWARIERGDEDAVVAGLVQAARETVEQRTGLVLGQRPFRLVLDAVPGEGRIGVPRRPVTAVTGVRTFDAEGSETVRAAATVRIAGEGLVVDPELCGEGGIEIEFTAGDDRVPEAVRQAILRIVAASYETRGMVGDAMQPAIVPAFADALLAPFRRVTL